MTRLPQRLALSVAALALSSNALAYVADGYLNDWLNGAQLTGSSDVKSSVGIFENDNGNPSGLGGQTYDTEYLLADVDWTTKTLHVAVVTGMRPNYGGTDYPDGSSGWRPGDLAIYTGSGYTGDGFWKVQTTNNPADGTTNALGWTTDNDPGSSSHQVDTARNPDVYGVYIPDLRDGVSTSSGTGHTSVTRDVQQNAVWFTNNLGGEFRPTSMAEIGDQRDLGKNGTDGSDNVGNKTGEAQVAYSRAAYDASTSSINFGDSSSSHYVIEAAIALTSLGWTEGDDTFNVALQWTMNCANDWISSSGSFFDNGGGNGGNNAVPEPTSLALLALGLVGVGYGRRRAASRSR